MLTRDPQNPYKNTENSSSPSMHTLMTFNTETFDFLTVRGADSLPAYTSFSPTVQWVQRFALFAQPRLT